jgi:hypothetical protein
LIAHNTSAIEARVEVTPTTAAGVVAVLTYLAGDRDILSLLVHSDNGERLPALNVIAKSVANL